MAESGTKKHKKYRRGLPSSEHKSRGQPNSLAKIRLIEVGPCLFVL